MLCWQKGSNVSSTVMLQVRWQSRGITDFLLDLPLLSSGSTFQLVLLSLQFLSQTSPCFPQHSNLSATWKCYRFCERWSSSWQSHQWAKHISLVGVWNVHGPESGNYVNWGLHWRFQDIVFQFQHKMKNGIAAEDVLQSKATSWKPEFWLFISNSWKKKFSMKMAETIKCMEGKNIQSSSCEIQYAFTQVYKHDASLTFF